MKRVVLALIGVSLMATLSSWPVAEVAADGGGWDETWGGGIDDLVIVNATDIPLAAVNGTPQNRSGAAGFSSTRPEWIWEHQASAEFRVHQRSALALHYELRYSLRTPGNPDEVAVGGLVISGFNDGIHDNDSLTCLVEGPHGLRCLVSIDDGYPRRATIVMMRGNDVRTDGNTPVGRALLTAADRICGLEMDNATCEFAARAGEPPATTNRTSVGPRLINCHTGDGAIDFGVSAGWSHTESISESFGESWGVSLGGGVKGAVKSKLTYSGYWDATETESHTYTRVDSVGIDVYGAKQLKHSWDHLDVGGDITVAQTNSDVRFSVTGGAFRVPQPNSTRATGDGDIVREGECPNQTAALAWLAEPVVGSGVGVEVAPSSGALAGRPAPTGTVTFRQAARVLCSDVPVVDARAECAVPIVPAGSSNSTVVAEYSGDRMWSPVNLDSTLLGNRPATRGTLPVRVVGADSQTAQVYLAADQCPGLVCEATLTAMATDHQFYPVTNRGVPAASYANCEKGSTGGFIQWTRSTRRDETSGHAVGVALSAGNDVVEVGLEKAFRWSTTKGVEFAETQSYRVSATGNVVVSLEEKIDGVEFTFDYAIRFADEWVVIENARRFVPYAGTDDRKLVSSVRAVTRPATPEDCTDIPSTTTLTIDTPTEWQVGQTIDLVANVQRPAHSPFRVNGGTVEFTDPRGRSLCVVPVVDSTARCAWTPSDAVVGDVEARFSGLIVLDQEMRLRSSSDSKRVQVRQPVTITAAVVGGDTPLAAAVLTAGDAGPVSGSVRFAWNGTTCDAPIVDNRAVACSTIPVGGHDGFVTITFGGNSRYAPAARLPRWADLGAAAATSDGVTTFVATLAAGSETVEFGEIVVGSSAGEVCRATVRASSATCQAELGAGTHELTMRYEGSTLWTAHTQTIEVDGERPTVQFTHTNADEFDDPGTPGRDFLVVGALDSVPLGTAVSGTVRVADGDVPLCITEVSGGGFTCSLQYEGDAAELTVEFLRTSQFDSASTTVALPPAAPPTDPELASPALAMIGDVACVTGAGHSSGCWGIDHDTGRAPPPDLGAVESLSVGRWHGCALLADRTATCWGGGAAGEAEAPVGELVALDVADSQYRSSSCGIRADHTLTCWGVPMFADDAAPTGTYTDLSVSDHRVCAVATDQQVECWYWGTSERPLDGSFIAISTTSSDVCGITTDSTIACTDHEWTSWLGDHAPTGTGFVDISIGSSTACALTGDGVAHCWTSSGVVDTPDLEFASVESGESGACGVTTDGDVVCWPTLTDSHPNWQWDPERMSSSQRALLDGAPTR